MKQFATWLLATALLFGGVPAWAEKIELQVDTNLISRWKGTADGSANVNLSTTLAGEDLPNQVQRVESQWEYEDVAASQTDQLLGSTGAAGDLFSGIVCNASAASVGVVSIKDGGGSSFTLFSAQSGATTQPLQLQNLGWISTQGAWSITTGTNTTCRASGRFS